MKFSIKRAWLYVTRKISTSIIIGIILFVVSSLILTGLVINTGTKKVSDLARIKLGSDVTIRSDLSKAFEKEGKGDRQNFMDLPDDFIDLGTNEVEEIFNKSKYLKSYTINTRLFVGPHEFTPYQVSNDNKMSMMKDMSISVIGANKKEYEQEFNKSTITSGEYFTDEEIETGAKKVIIEETIAKLNNLKVGDKIKLYQRAMSASGGMIIMDQNQNNDEPVSENEIVEYEIKAIYKTTEPTSTTGGRMMTVSENTVYMPYKAVFDLSKVGMTEEEITEQKELEEKIGYTIESATFVLKDPADLDKFLEEVKTIEVNLEYRMLDANNEAYEQMTKPIENVAKTSGLLVIVVVITGLFIIGLITILSIKDRKYELGVLLSLGASKTEIIGQLITEMLIVGVISFALSGLLSNFTAQGITNHLLTQELNTKTEENNRPDKGFVQSIGPGSFGNKNNNTEVINSLEVKVEASDILAMLGLGVLIIIISNSAQAAFVLRANPKEILVGR